jgi:Mrp family chromosome partitioning ATPase
MARLGGRRKQAPEVDELGGRSDGALAILTPDRKQIHFAPARVTSALRFVLARVQMQEGLPSRLALTAALKGEGVTYVTRTLGALIAYDTDARVAVLDLNWRRPKERTEDADTRPSLVDAIERDVSVDEILQPTANPRLFLVDAGEVAPSRRPALAATRKLEIVLDELESRFDHMLMDLPPVLASSDAISLAQLADAYALVVRQGAATTNQIDTALEELRGTETIGVILNRVESKVPRRLRRLLGA